MKWFKHFSDAKYDARVLRLIKKYGLKGYGLYFAMVEYAANQLKTENPIPDVEENSKDIATFFNEDTLLIEEIILFCLNEGLFEQDEKTGRIICFKLLCHLDNTMSNNPEIKQILNNFKKLKVYSSTLKQTRLDKTRLNKTRLDKTKKENNINNEAVQVLNYLNEKTGHKYKPVKSSLQYINARLKEKFTVEQCKKVIDTMYVKWKGTKYEQYLTYKTLFYPDNFQRYLEMEVPQETISDNDFIKYKDTAIRVLKYLNEQAKRNYEYDRDEDSLTNIIAVLKHGYTEDECKRVIDIKVSHWMDKADMNQYLNYKTLFDLSKFKRYLHDKKLVWYLDKDYKGNDKWIKVNEDDPRVQEIGR